MSSLRDDPSNPRWLRKALRELPRTIADLLEQFGNAALHARPDGEEWKITLNSDYIPRLRISSTYRDLIAKGALSKDERDYLKERIRSGKFIIDSIEQRHRTIERITREIISAQREFFAKGVAHLKPLTLRQVAEARAQRQQ